MAGALVHAPRLKGEMHMDIDVSAEVVIDRPRQEVASYVENPENEPVWIGGIVESKPLTDPPVGVGGTQIPPTAEGGALRSQDLRTPGDALTYDGALIALDPDTGGPGGDGQPSPHGPPYSLVSNV